MMDANGSLICSLRYDVEAMAFYHPTIITRRLTQRPGMWEVTGRISADLATFNQDTGRWDLVNGLCVSTDSAVASKPVASYHAADLLPKEIAIRRKSGYNALLSSRQLAALAAQQTKIKDMAQLLSQKHFRITDPIINLTMLMVSLPVLICRDPRTMKSAVLVSFALTAACFVTTFVCKMFATETVFTGRVMPELWAWLPVFIFLPIAFIELDSMKT
jgi:lipopolysaccharide export LptBFGC system permease protein LptF